MNTTVEVEWNGNKFQLKQQSVLVAEEEAAVVMWWWAVRIARYTVFGAKSCLRRQNSSR